ncbi:hypothetical protein KI387_038742, partial [Taxus chinensis]
QHYDQIQNHYAYPYEQCQNHFGYEAYQEQGYAYNDNSYMENVDLLEKIQRMEANM